ncbi:MAG TPA: sulfonate/nitrate/taurine transporter substrate-binding protein [Clostridiales bacterium]|jgi:NitT/TauT family transport system substrate-binding protein|nr:sulfonate/nitrate/taurine transporter substrate-binding protein [Clostridiales bacterium]HCG34894.1 sulfonate/nitrate/taurine transporter substrate-binding protein [Clostridiales bacterium]
MKKIVSIFLMLAVLMWTFAMASCSGRKTSDERGSDNTGNDQNEQTNDTHEDAKDTTTIRIGGLKGPTSIGLVKVMEDNANKTSVNSYEFTIAGSADELTPKLMQGQLDMAAVPANLASVLYNNTNGAIQMIAINTLGVLYIVEKGETINAMADLKGKTIYATGKGSTPEYTLRYILAENGIDPDKDVTIEWKSEPTEVVALLALADSGIAMMPQPYVTIAQNTISTLRIAVDLTKEWENLDNGSRLLTGVMVIREAFAKEHPSLVASFLQEYQASAQYVNDNVEEAALLVEKFDIVKAAIAKKAIPHCNITLIMGAEMKAIMQGYLQVLLDEKPAAIGGTLPSDTFYYVQ